MAGASVYLRNKLLGTLDNTAFSVAATYLSLHDVDDPGDTGTGAIAVARQTVTWAAPSSGSISNSNAPSFTSMPATTVRAFGVWDASTGGNLLFTVSVAPIDGDTVAANATYTVDAGDIAFTLGSGAANASTTLVHAWLNTLRATSFATQAYAALHTANPGSTGASEVSGGTYSRRLADLTVAAGATSASAAQLDFTGMPATTVAGVSLWNASTAGTMLWSGTIPAKTVKLNRTFRVYAGSITVTLAAGASNRSVAPSVQRATLRWPYDSVFNFVRSPVVRQLASTVVTAGERPVRNGRFTGPGASTTTNSDLRLIFPDEPVDIFGGLWFSGWRSVEIVGGELAFNTLWPQKWVDNAGVTAGSFATFDGDYVTPNWQGRNDWVAATATVPAHLDASTAAGTRTEVANEAGQTDTQLSPLHVINSNRAFYTENVGTLFIEGVAVSGQWLFELFNFNAAAGNGGNAGKVYIQGFDLRTDVIWRQGWPDAQYSFDQAHNGGDMLQMMGPIELYMDDYRALGSWYQGFFFKPGDNGSAPGTVGVPLVDMSHMVMNRHRGYGGGAFVYWVSGNVRVPFRVTAKDECYIHGETFGNVQTAWQTGIRGNKVTEKPSTATATNPRPDIYVAAPNNPAGTTAKDPYAHPTYSGNGASVRIDANVNTGTFGQADLGTDAATGDRFAYFAATGHTATVNGVTYTNASTYLDVKIWSLDDRTPDYSTWPFKISSEPGAAAWWSTSGKGYPRQG